jgi:hypothetical protein
VKKQPLYSREAIKIENGQFDYEPNPDSSAFKTFKQSKQTVIDTFEYACSDGRDTSDVASVDITIFDYRPVAQDVQIDGKIRQAQYTIDIKHFLENLTIANDPDLDEYDENLQLNCETLVDHPRVTPYCQNDQLVLDFTRFANGDFNVKFQVSDGLLNSEQHTISGSVDRSSIYCEDFEQTIYKGTYQRLQLNENTDSLDDDTLTYSLVSGDYPYGIISLENSRQSIYYEAKKERSAPQPMQYQYKAENPIEEEICTVTIYQPNRAPSAGEAKYTLPIFESKKDYVLTFTNVNDPDLGDQVYSRKEPELIDCKNEAKVEEVDANELKYRFTRLVDSPITCSFYIYVRDTDQDQPKDATGTMTVELVYQPPITSRDVYEIDTKQEGEEGSKEYREVSTNTLIENDLDPSTGSIDKLKITYIETIDNRVALSEDPGKDKRGGLIAFMYSGRTCDVVPFKYTVKSEVSGLSAEGYAVAKFIGCKSCNPGFDLYYLMDNSLSVRNEWIPMKKLVDDISARLLGPSKDNRAGAVFYDNDAEPFEDGKLHDSYFSLNKEATDNTEYQTATIRGLFEVKNLMVSKGEKKNRIIVHITDGFPWKIWNCDETAKLYFESDYSTNNYGVKVGSQYINGVSAYFPGKLCDFCSKGWPYYGMPCQEPVTISEEMNSWDGNNNPDGIPDGTVWNQIAIVVGHGLNNELGSWQVRSQNYDTLDLIKFDRNRVYTAQNVQNIINQICTGFVKKTTAPKRPSPESIGVQVTLKSRKIEELNNEGPITTITYQIEHIGENDNYGDVFRLSISIPDVDHMFYYDYKPFFPVKKGKDDITGIDGFYWSTAPTDKGNPLLKIPEKQRATVTLKLRGRWTTERREYGVVRATSSGGTCYWATGMTEVPANYDYGGGGSVRMVGQQKCLSDGQKCYYLIKHPAKKFDYSQFYCRLFNSTASVASAKSNEEWNFIQSQFDFSAMNSNIWFGLTKGPTYIANRVLVTGYGMKTLLNISDIMIFLRIIVIRVRCGTMETSPVVY